MKSRLIKWIQAAFKKAHTRWVSPPHGLIQRLNQHFHQDPHAVSKSAFLILALCMLVFILIPASKPLEKKNKGVVVSTAVAHAQDVSVFLEALGTVTPTQNVTVKTQVNGQLTRVLFDEGQLVKKDELIAEIDEQPYLAQLHQYEGQLMRDQALLNNAKVDLMRYEELYPQQAVSKQTLDSQTWLVKQYEGAVKLDEGLVEQATVNLSYCKITSPTNGRVGLRLVDQGNVVNTTDPNGLTVINTIDPIAVVFTLPEDALPKLLPHRQKNTPLKTLAFDRSNKVLLAEGTFLALDNQVDPNTGTVKLKAVFTNKENKLFPSQFVNIKIEVDQLSGATLIPTHAISHGAKGPYTYVINHKNEAKITPLTLSATHEDHTVISTGITPGDVVVTQGAEKLKEGSQVILETKVSDKGGT